MKARVPNRNEITIIPKSTATPIKAQEATAPAINLNPINNKEPSTPVN